MLLQISELPLMLFKLPELQISVNHTILRWQGMLLNQLIQSLILQITSHAQFSCWHYHCQFMKTEILKLMTHWLQMIMEITDSSFLQPGTWKITTRMLLMWPQLHTILVVQLHSHSVIIMVLGPLRARAAMDCGTILTVLKRSASSLDILYTELINTSTLKS